MLQGCRKVCKENIRLREKICATACKWFACALFGMARQSVKGVLTVCLVCMSLVSPMRVFSDSAPECPEGVASEIVFAAVGDAPIVSTWRDVAVLPADCHIDLVEPAELIVALAGLISYSGSVKDMAERLGSVSDSRGLLYWSVTDEQWQELISDAAALATTDAKSLRDNFNGQEILSGDALYFLQNDTRSWGNNVYSIRAIESSEDHLIVESKNLSPVRVGPLTIFKPGDAINMLFIRRVDESTWQYYGLAAVKASGLAVREKSLINRQAAFFRWFTGEAPDKEPPLAK